MIYRFYERLEKLLRANKVLVIYGPRRLGKTTLLTQYLKKTKLKTLSVIGDNLGVQEILSSQRIDKIKKFVDDHQLLIIIHKFFDFIDPL